MQDTRWKQRYMSYSKILGLLYDNLLSKSPNDYSELEQIGLAKSFELCFELMWKLLKDYLEYENVEIGLISPKNILKSAASKGLLQLIDADGDVLINAHITRNGLVHVYDQAVFYQALMDVKELYLPEMLKVKIYFEGLISNG